MSREERGEAETLRKREEEKREEKKFIGGIGGKKNVNMVILGLKKE